MTLWSKEGKQRKGLKRSISRLLKSTKKEESLLNNIKVAPLKPRKAITSMFQEHTIINPLTFIFIPPSKKNGTNSLVGCVAKLDIHPQNV